MQNIKKLSPGKRLLVECGLILSLVGCRTPSQETPFHVDHDITSVAADDDVTCGKTCADNNSDHVIATPKGAELLKSDGAYLYDFYHADSPAGEPAGIALGQYTIYVATKSEGIFLYDTSGNHIGKIDLPAERIGTVRSITRAGSDSFWNKDTLLVNTTEGGILRYDTKGNYLGKLPKDESIVAIAADKRTDSNIYLLDQGDFVTEVGNDGSLIAQVPLHLVEGAGDVTAFAERDPCVFKACPNVFVGTSSGEVDRFDQTGTLTLRIGAQGVTGPVVGLAMGTDNNIEIAHPNGVEIVDANSGNHEDIYATGLSGLPKPAPSSVPPATSPR